MFAFMTFLNTQEGVLNISFITYFNTQTGLSMFTYGTYMVMLGGHEACGYRVV